MIILLSLLIITSHSITSLVLLSTYFLLFVIKLINRDYRYTNLIILVYLLFILWNLSNSEADLLKPYLYNMINSSLSQIYMSIMYAISPSYSNSIGVNSVNSNLFEFLILYRYLFYIIIALFSAITVFYLIKKRMTYYLVLIGISQIFVIPFLSYISGNYVFRIITHWGMPLLCIFSSYAFIKQLSKKQFSLLYCMLFMLFFAYFIAAHALQVFTFRETI